MIPRLGTHFINYGAMFLTYVSSHRTHRKSHIDDEFGKTEVAAGSERCLALVALDTTRTLKG